jgi:hypothetical protein
MVPSNAGPANKAANQIASGVQALMNNKQVKSDVHMIDAFHQHFLFLHFSFFCRRMTTR